MNTNKLLIFIILLIFIFTILFVFWNLFLPIYPDTIIKGCSGNNCKSNSCVGRGCSVLPCIGDFCTAGNCTGEKCKAGDCYGYNCKAGDCYGSGCIPGKCLDTTCKTNDCPQSAKTCKQGSFYKIVRPFYWNLTKYLPADSLLNPPLCYNSILQPTKNGNCEE